MVKSTYVIGCNGGVNSEQISRPIVLACDAAYAMPLATALRSIVETNRNGWSIEFHVLSDGLSEDTRRRVFDSLPKESASIRWVPVDLGPFREFSTIAHVSKVSYARLLIPHIFPDTISKVLYLDADVLVLDDLGPIWETNLGGAVVGAVLDKIDPQLKWDEPGLEEVPRVRDYFNAGVLLIDLDRWKKERISEKAMQYLIRHPRTPFSDQDALNVVCDGLWKKLDPRWNFQDHYEQKKISDISPGQRPGIVHFLTDAKPWNACMPGLNACLYDSFRSQTRFARTTKDKLWDIMKSGLVRWPRDVLQGIWSHLKGVLRRYAFLRAIRERVRSPKRR